MARVSTVPLSSTCGHSRSDADNAQHVIRLRRWLSPDPAGDGWNAYAYPTDPNSEIDPSGLTTISYSVGDLHNCRTLGYGPTSCVNFSSDDYGACLTVSCILQKDNVAPVVHGRARYYSGSEVFFEEIAIDPSQARFHADSDDMVPKS
jgi:uncharacterized protein RhaS with RHS repeats